MHLNWNARPKTGLAWIPTGISRPNKKDRLSENEMKTPATEPRDRRIGFVEAGCQQ